MMSYVAVGYEMSTRVVRSDKNKDSEYHSTGFQLCLALLADVLLKQI